MRTVDEINDLIVLNESLLKESSEAIEKFYADMENDAEVQKAHALIKEWSDNGRVLDKKHDELRNQANNLISELYERERFDKEQAARQVGAFDAESAHAFLTSIKCIVRSTWGNNNEMRVGLHRPKLVKDSFRGWKESFYLKKVLSNGVQIYHDYADYGIVRYFAFKGCDLVGYYNIKRSEHPGDYTYIYAFVNQETYNHSNADGRILLKDWMAKLESSTTFVSANVKDNDTASMLYKN